MSNAEKILKAIQKMCKEQSTKRYFSSNKDVLAKCDFSDEVLLVIQDMKKGE